MDWFILVHLLTDYLSSKSFKKSSLIAFSLTQRGNWYAQRRIPVWFLIHLKFIVYFWENFRCLQDYDYPKFILLLQLFDLITHSKLRFWTNWVSLEPWLVTNCDLNWEFRWFLARYISPLGMFTREFWFLSQSYRRFSLFRASFHHYLI